MKSYLEKIGGLVVLGTVFLMPLVFIPGLRDCFALPKVALLRFAGLILFVIFLLYKFCPGVENAGEAGLPATPRRTCLPDRQAGGKAGMNAGNHYPDGHFQHPMGLHFSINRVSVVVLVYLLVRIITTILSKNPSISWQGRYLFYFEGTQQLLCFVIFYFAVRFVTGRQIYKSIAMTSILAAAYGIIQYLNIDPIKWDTYFGGVISTFGNPNFFAGWLVFVLPVLFYEVIKGRYLFLIPVIMSFISLVLANVSAGFVALGASAVFFILLCRKEIHGRLGVRVFLTVLAACMFFAGFFGLNRLSDPSVSSRIVGWKATLEAIKSRPVIGYGPDTFADEVSKMLPAEYDRLTKKNANPGYAHNIFLDQLFSSGIAGLLCFLWLLLVFFRSTGNPALKMAVFGGLVFGLFHFWTLEMWLCFWVFLALGQKEEIPLSPPFTKGEGKKEDL